MFEVKAEPLRKTMDDLSTLPNNVKTIMTPEEQLVIDRYFPEAVEGCDTLKMMGISTVLFLALANPITEGLLQRVPFCNGNMIAIMLVKVLVFVIALFLLSR